MEKFDPFFWLEKLLPARIIHLAIRIFMSAILTGLLIRQILLYHFFIFKPLWMVETLMLSMFLVSYLIRKDPVSRARGTKEVFFPVIGALLPFLLLFFAPQFMDKQSFACFAAIILLDDRSRRADSMGIVGAAPFFQHYGGSAGISHKRTVSVYPSPRLCGGNPCGAVHCGLAVFSAECPDRGAVCGYPVAAV